ncbi:glnS [Symbiodinium microadriaticum]|nr:glnS [Symbiodinium microadriaticum]
MRGWSDPRMPTIKGLRRRGFSAEVMNTFCTQIGVTRNENTVEYEKLTSVARAVLHEKSPRVMAVLNPVLVVIANLAEVAGPAAAVAGGEADGVVQWEAPDFPHDPARGSHFVQMVSTVYIDQSDIRLVDSPDFFGFAPDKIVGLKYAFRVHVDSVETNDQGDIERVLVTALPLDSSVKPKTSVQWVSTHLNVPMEARMYSTLFTCEEVPDDEWEKALNPTSEVVHANGFVDASIFKWNPVPESGFQFERLGFFVVDSDSAVLPSICPSTAVNVENPKLVFNLTVPLKVSIAFVLLCAQRH